MMKKIVATVLVAGVAAVGATTASASVNSCSDTGSGDRNTCRATTFEKKVAFASVRMGRWSSGSWTLTCTKGGNVYRKTGHLGTGGRITSAINHPNSPDCKLRATARAFNGHPAYVRVALRKH